MHQVTDMDLVTAAAVGTLTGEADDKVRPNGKLRLAIISLIHVFCDIFPEVAIKHPQISAAFLKSLSEGIIVQDHKKNDLGSHIFILIFCGKCNCFLENQRRFF